MAQIQFHHAEFRVYAQATEDEAKVREALAFVTGDLPVERTMVEGQHGNPIVLLAAKINQTAKVRAFLARLVEDDEVRAGILATLAQRMDEEGAFFLRLAKQEAYMRRFALGGGEDAIHVRMKVATYPVRGEVARERLREFLTALGTRKDK